MRIGLVSHEPFYPPSGGGSLELVEVVKALRGRGHDVSVFSPQIRDPERVAKELGVTLHQFSLFEMSRYTNFRIQKYILYPLIIQNRLKKLVKKDRLDLLATQHSISSLAAGLVHKSIKKPIVMNYLDFLTGFLYDWPVFRNVPLFTDVLFRSEVSFPNIFSADRLLTISDSMSRVFVERGYPKERTRAIGYGVDTHHFSPKAEKAMDFDGPVVSLHGTLDPHHGGTLFIKTAKAVIEKRPEVKFLVVGKGQYLAHLKKRAKELGIAKNMIFTGWVDYEKIPGYVRSADLTIVPYGYTKGLDYSIFCKALESLSVEKPVVCTRSTAMAELFRGKEFVGFADFSVQSLRDEILRMLDKTGTQRAKLGRDGRKFVEDSMSWEKVTGRMVSAYEELA